VPIIGVVNDIRQVSMSSPAVPTVYLHNLQNSRVQTTLVVRTAGDPMAMANALREVVWSVDRLQPITSVFTYDDAIHSALARPRLLTVLLGAFGGLGLLLGAIGLYGVLAYLVSQRQREIGVRIAIGAAPSVVSRMVVRRGMTLTVIGVVIGTVGALATSRYMADVLYGVGPTDPVTFIAVAAVLLGVAALASWVPARRAAAVDPVVALRAE
jgi:ABC-type antimicrobial peptide transport system permease subunit